MIDKPMERIDWKTKMRAKAAIAVPRYMGCRTILIIPVLTRFPCTIATIVGTIRMAAGIKRTKPMISNHTISARSPV